MGRFDGASVNIRRASVRNHVGTCKTPESVATLPLLPQVLIPLVLWRQKKGNPSEGWVFPNERGKAQRKGLCDAGQFIFSLHH
jgi:hypothetical protein